MDKKTTILTIIALMITGVVVYLGSNPTTTYAKMLGIKNTDEPHQLYHVYLGGESLGLIESQEELEKFIDEKQSEIKKKYQVDKVYVPNDLDIVQEITYVQKVSTVEEIYQKIQEKRGSESFTIDGYKIDIEGIEKESEGGETVTTPDIVLYVLDEEVFTNSVEKTITSFINEDSYHDFLNDTQAEIQETGTIIEDLYIQNNISIHKGRIPTGEKIYLTEDELSKYLLFGTVEDQATYTVQEGDTIEDIAFNNKLSPEEFLIANTEYTSTNDLLYPGKEVVLGVIQPQFDTVEETHVVSKKTVEIQTVYEDDPNQYTGYEKVKQEGSEGLSLVTEKQKLVNGEITTVVPVSEEVLVPAVNKVIVRGTKKYSNIGNSSISNQEVPVGVGSWVWPTTVPYTISSSFGYRWGKLHEGIDISGIGRGSPIKAANNGLVIQSGYTRTNGNYIVIAHSNGYYTMYAHMNSRIRKAGDVVMAGDQIGTAGDSGFATGVHLHFAIYRGMPYRGGVAVSPFNFF